MPQVSLSLTGKGSAYTKYILGKLGYRIYVEDILVIIPRKLETFHNLQKLIAYGACKAIELVAFRDKHESTANTVMVSETCDHKMRAIFQYTDQEEQEQEEENRKATEYLQKEKELLEKIKQIKNDFDSASLDLAAARRGRDMHYEHEQVMRAKYEASEVAYNELREENARLVRKIAQLEKGGEIVEAPVAVDAVDVTTVSRAVCPEERLDILFRAIDKLTK